jgi:hypothetical protein
MSRFVTVQHVSEGEVLINDRVPLTANTTKELNDLVAEFVQYARGESDLL